MYVHEPDNDTLHPLAVFGVRNVGHVATLEPSQLAPAYEALWRLGYAGGWPTWSKRRAGVVVARTVPPAVGGVRTRLLAATTARGSDSARTVVVKTVRADFAIEWLVERFQPRVVVVLRNPLNMLGSWLERGWGAHTLLDSEPVRTRFEPCGLWPPPPLSSAVENAMWAVCARSIMLREAANRHPDWVVVEHEILCSDPIPQFQRLVGAIGLQWSEAIESYLHESNRPGTSWEVQRVASEEVGRWRKRLTPAQQAAAHGILTAFARTEVG